ncbi:MAG: LPS assembly lipoprotein LptE [Candidatus Omnitrophica bacterium]|nr:LPS assembly lipoprotein LptE [Candidatus Omnitrophota bacterium]
MRKIIFYLMGFLILGGCGYTTRAFISQKYKTIYVAPFENKIDITKETESMRRYKLYRPLLERDIYEAVILRFNRDGNLRVTSKEDSDLILEAVLFDFRRDPLRYLDNEEVEEYRISIEVKINLKERKDDKILKEATIIGDTTYFVLGPNRKSEPTAIQEAVDDVSRRIVEYIVENW